MATNQNDFEREYYRVVHPLNDVPEEKCSCADPGLMRMTPAVRFSLKLLRGYLFLMTAMLLFHVMDLSGIAFRLK